jgi:hypothetical protein
MRRLRTPSARATRLALLVALAAGLTASLTARHAHAQSFQSEADIVEGNHRYRSPQRFAFELRFGPYRPDIDSEFSGSRSPYQDYFGSGSKLLTQIELDYEFFHRVGSLGVGLGAGFFQVTGNAPVASGTGMITADTSQLRILPFSASLVYRFDYFLETRNFPLVPYAKVGLDYAYWRITDGNGDTATDGRGGRGVGGTLGWHGSAGIAFVLDWLDPEAAHDFDADMGVNHTALVFEFNHADISGLGMSNRLHVGDDTWSLGLLLQF